MAWQKSTTNKLLPYKVICGRCQSVVTSDELTSIQAEVCNCSGVRAAGEIPERFSYQSDDSRLHATCPHCGNPLFVKGVDSY